jgi:hypothetical protein
MALNNRRAQNQKNRNESNGEPIPEITAHKASSIFHKTIMCRFFDAGVCNKGSDCKFAHSKADMSSKPDLSHTKICPKLANGGSCFDPKCGYAHNKSQLKQGKIRRLKHHKQPGAAEETSPGSIPLPPGLHNGDQLAPTSPLSSASLTTSTSFAGLQSVGTASYTSLDPLTLDSSCLGLEDSIAVPGATEYLDTSALIQSLALHLGDHGQGGYNGLSLPMPAKGPTVTQNDLYQAEHWKGQNQAAQLPGRLELQSLVSQLLELDGVACSLGA